MRRRAPRPEGEKVMEDALSAKRPVHLWIVGILATIWKAFGAIDYVMTQTANEAYLSQMTSEQRDYFVNFPPLLDAAWALGVWGAFLGSLLLLTRSRHAVSAFAVSLIGLAISTAYQYFVATPPGSIVNGVYLAMNIAIWAIAIALLLYARRERANGVLR